MRTTIDLDDTLLATLKARAASTGRTMSSLVEEAVRQMLTREAAPRKRKRIRLPTGGRGGTLPGIDLDDNAALLDVMDGPG